MRRTLIGVAAAAWVLIVVSVCLSTAAVVDPPPDARIVIRTRDAVRTRMARQPAHARWSD